MDKLQEISKKAASKASDALSKLIDMPVVVGVDRASVENVQELYPIIGSEAIVAGIYIPVTGTIKGAALLILPQETAFNLSDLLVKREVGTTRKITELDESALKEVGNIICGNYFTVFSNTLQVKITEHVPKFSFDMFGAIVSQIIAEFAEDVEKALVIEIEFKFEHLNLNGYFLLLLRMEEINAILRALEIKDQNN